MNELPGHEQGPSFLDTLRAERRDILNRLRMTRFDTLKPGYSHAQVVPHATYAPWLDNRDFRSTYDSIRSHTLVDEYRCYELFQLASQVRQVEGDLVEVGVWRGGTAAILARAARGKTIHLFDTFRGVVKADKRFDTSYRGGEHADTDRALVDELFDRLRLARVVNVGIFPEETLGGLPEMIALAHIDVDTYASARDAFAAIWPRLSTRGMVVFDDYGFFACEGVAHAVNQIVESLPNALFVHNLNGHGLLVKVC